MKHLGDITKISGYTAPVVDCIIGGSPCQDLSVAGKRAGLDGERSGLYIEQVRIVKEMRERDERINGRTGDDVRPRYMVRENVPGAFSSNKGEDFRIVLEEIAKVCAKDAVIPMPDKGKWTNHGCILGDGWSVAWRVLDAQFWGVPQRRRRIALVADFGGHSAPEILFVRQSVSGHSDEGKQKRKTTPSDAQGGIGADDCIGTATAYGISSYNSNAMKSSNPHSGIYEADTSRTLDLNGGNPSCNQGGIAIVESVPYTLKIRSGCEGGGKGALVQEDKRSTLATNNDQYLFQPVVFTKSKREQAATDNETWVESDTACTLNAFDVGDVRTTEAVVYALDRASYQDKVGALCARDFKGIGSQYVEEDKLVVAVDCRNGTEDTVNGALQFGAFRSLNCNNVVRTRYIVRRLTPLECERLQGYPSELKLDISKMTKDEYIAYNILEGNIIVDAEAGKVYRTRGPGGATLDKPQEMKGSDCNGYLVVKISNGTTKMSCRIHRIIWISQHGVIPDGYCIDHINSDKKDNRISNLQLLTPQENSTKAAKDGLYATGEDNGATKISPDLWDEIAYLHHCEGKTMRQLAEIYGISKSRIQQIVKEVGWTDIGEWTDSNGKTRQTSDAARYKALGNSIALPPWKWVLKRLCACYERDATMASLFDGIGGFPYLWEQLNGKGSCLWASEIEDFPIAVTKVRIGEDDA